MNPKIKKQWIKALRSGDYKQGKEQLRNGENQFCCLGVLCNLHAKANSEFAKQQILPSQYDGETGVLPLSVMKWAQIDFANPVVRYKGHEVSLAELNDGGYIGCRLEKPKTFKQIANIIEKSL